jgi:hypothetical protein
MKNTGISYCIHMIYIQITSYIKMTYTYIQITFLGHVHTDYIQITYILQINYISFAYTAYTTYTTYATSCPIQCTMIQLFSVGLYLLVTHFRAHVLMYYHLQPSAASSFESHDAPGGSLASLRMQYGMVPVVSTGTTGNLTENPAEIKVPGTT